MVRGKSTEDSESKLIPYLKRKPSSGLILTEILNKVMVYLGTEKRKLDFWTLSTKLKTKV